MDTNLIEVFSSTQGEGPYLGFRQVFLRFAGCNLACAYCDTAHDPTSHFRMETVPGSAEFTYFQNPGTVHQLAELIIAYESVHSISLTGGEPLLHTDFISSLIEALNNPKYKIYLETNGSLPKELRKLISAVDIISMDMKIPSTSECGDMWAIHREFLKIGSQKEIFIKIVVSSATSEEEIIKTCNIIKEVDPGIPLILQPVTPSPGFAGCNPSVKQLLDQQSLAMKYIRDVRVIPQTQKFTGQL